ncbi:hypothetical protein JCM10207_000109 [Rhodosporidiobolus poonsookiae]
MPVHVHYPSPPVVPSCAQCAFQAGITHALSLLPSPSSSSSSSASSAFSSRSSTPPTTPNTPPSDYTPSPSPGCSTPPLEPLPLPFDFPASSSSPAPPRAPFGADEEQQYLDLARRIATEGEDRPAVKGGVGARALFSPPPLSFSLSSPADPSNPFSTAHTLHVPLLSTKTVPFPLVAKELVWFLSGSSSEHDLAREGCHIWRAHGAREYLDARGLTDNEEGDLGPVYGFQWRHAGAEYRGAKEDYEGKGVDQLAELVRRIKEEPQKRKLILCAWSASDFDKMALAPCPCFVQFYVHSPKPAGLFSTPQARLSCAVYQRSADIALGLPFDIVTYALLTHTLAHLTSLVPHTLHFHLGDAHVYADHLAPLQTQLAREPKGWPELRWTRGREEIEREGGVDGVTVGDWEVVGYAPEGRVRYALHP